MPASTEEGFASSVISIPGAKPHNVSASPSSVATSAGGISEGVPPPKKIELEGLAAGQFRLVPHVGEQRLAPLPGVDPLTHMRIEIAVRAFRQAERPMDIQRLCHGAFSACVNR